MRVSEREKASGAKRVRRWRRERLLRQTRRLDRQQAVNFSSYLYLSELSRNARATAVGNGQHAAMPGSAGKYISRQLCAVLLLSIHSNNIMRIERVRTLN